MSWFDTSLTCEGVCQLFDVFHHELSNLSLSCEGLFRFGLTSISCLLFNIANAGHFSTKIISPLVNEEEGEDVSSVPKVKMLQKLVQLVVDSHYCCHSLHLYWQLQFLALK